MRTVNKGFSLIDVLVGGSILLIVFVGIFGVLRLATAVIGNGKAKVGAVALAQEQIEFVRSLNYDAVGTMGGIPSGDISQEEIINLNNIVYTRRTFVQFVDADADGVGASDTNGITSDYKVVKVEVQWENKGSQKEIQLVTNVVPRGLETIAGGGTLKINVFDSVGVPIVSADVHIVNENINPAIDVTTFTNNDGQVIFPGSPDATGYQVMVTKNGYSTSQTYDANSSNPNPNPGHLTVLEGQTTELSFAIDLLSAKTVRTFRAIEQDFFEDSFIDTTGLIALDQTEVLSGDLQLKFDVLNGYALSGSAEASTTEHTYLSEWIRFSWNDLKPVGTTALYRLLYESSPEAYSLVPDSALAGNSSGFSTSPVDLSGVSTSTYSGLRARAYLTTNSTTTTPTVSDWKIEYKKGPTPLPNISFSMRGTKQIGTDGSGSPIYKYTESSETDVSGEVILTDLEWDTYIIDAQTASLNLDVSESCTPQPRGINPGIAVVTKIILSPHTANSLLVSVLDDSDSLISGASVRLYRSPSVDRTEETGSCGQTFFDNLSTGTVVGGTTYSIDTTATGFQNQTISDVEVIASSTLSIIMNAL